MTALFERLRPSRRAAPVEPTAGRVLEVTDLDVAYGKTQVLFGVDFHVDEGEIVALLGTNGAGKSTLLSAVAGLLEPSRGRILFDGRDVTHWDANETVAEAALADAAARANGGSPGDTGPPGPPGPGPSPNDVEEAKR